MRPQVDTSNEQGEIQKVQRDCVNGDHQIGLAEIVLRRGSEPPLIQHQREDLAIYVLSGRLTILVNEKSHQSARGSRILVPRDWSYGFAVRSFAAHLLIIVTPAGAENWYSELQSALVPRTTPSAGEDSWGTEHLVSLAARYGINIVGPPPAIGGIALPLERQSIEPQKCGSSPDS